MKKNSKNNKEQYPIELPARENKTTHTPITDVVETEIFPLDCKSPYENSRKNSGVQGQTDIITEVVTTEIFPEE